MNKIFRLVVEIAFSLFIGVLIVFTVASLLTIIWPGDPYYTGDVLSESRNFDVLYQSLAAVTIATFLQFGSLFMSERLRVLANGILCGGVFTTLFGVLSISSYNSPSPWWMFIITLFALLVATVVGWLKFIRLAKQAATPVPLEMEEVSERLYAVEATLERMRKTFSASED